MFGLWHSKIFIEIARKSANLFLEWSLPTVPTQASVILAHVQELSLSLSLSLSYYISPRLSSFHFHPHTLSLFHNIIIGLHINNFLIIANLNILFHIDHYAQKHCLSLLKTIIVPANFLSFMSYIVTVLHTTVVRFEHIITVSDRVVRVQQALFNSPMEMWAEWKYVLFYIVAVLLFWLRALLCGCDVYQCDF
jgi:hypothetical protein